MRVIAAAGGTAGHVNPMLATARELISRGHDVIALGTKEGLEADLVPAAGLDLVTIDRVPLPRKPSLDLLRLPSRLRGAVGSVRELAARSNADLILGFGGYVSAPAYLAARSNLPIVVQEQNAKPGIANRLGARHAAGVALTFPDTPLAAKRGITRVTGLPLREEIAELAADLSDPERARARRVAAAAAYGLDPGRPVILVTGGSSGAQKLNETMAGSAEAIAGHAQVLHITGKGKSAGIVESPGYRVIEYETDMARAYAVADLVVSRSGAGMVAELAALALPAVVVPLPIGNGEQYLNAKSLIDAGGFAHVPNEDFTPAAVTETVLPLLGRVDEMSRALAAAGVTGGASGVADLIEEVA